MGLMSVYTYPLDSLYHSNEYPNGFQINKCKEYEKSCNSKKELKVITTHSIAIEVVNIDDWQMKVGRVH